LVTSAGIISNHLQSPIVSAGAIVVALTIRGDMRRRGVWLLTFQGTGNGDPVALGDSWQVLSEFIAASYSIPSGCSLFLAMAGTVVGGFAGLQAHRIAVGVTTNEGFKRKDLEDAYHAAVTRDGGGGAWMLPARHPYHRGWKTNLAEVLFPRTALRRALKRYGEKTE
jgi:hypothetical protein